MGYGKRAMPETYSSRQTPSQERGYFWQENNAHEKYLGCLGKKEIVGIKNIGLVVSPRWPLLGCSSDGIVLENGVPISCIEIKWPYSKRDMMHADAD